MPDEEVVTEQQEETDAASEEEVPQEQADEQIGGEERDDDPEQSAEDDAAAVSDDEDDGSRARWGELIPDLAGEYDNLSAQAKERILLDRLRAKTADDASRKTSQDDETVRRAASESRRAVEVRPIDLDGLKRTFEEVLGETDGPKVSTQLESVVKYVNGIAELTLKALSEHDSKLDEAVLPGRFAQARIAVRGATEADEAAARKLYESGMAQTPVAAIKLAVFDRREAEERRTPKKQPSEQAKRLAASIQASGRGASGVRNATGPARLPQTEEEWVAHERKLMARHKKR